MSEMNQNMLTSFPAEILSENLGTTQFRMIAQTSNELRNHFTQAKRLIKLKNKTEGHCKHDLTLGINSLQQHCDIQSITLVYLHLHDNYDSRTLFETIQSCKTLSRLRISACSLGDNVIQILTTGLPEWKSLEWLDFESDVIMKNSIEVKQLFTRLPLCRSLTRLGFCSSAAMMNPGNFIAFVQVLPGCTSLAHLDLGQNRIGAEGAGRLAAVLGQCASLAHLNLTGNQIGRHGVERLAAVLPLCRSLVHLNLANNQLGDEATGRLAAVLGQCASLAVLSLSENYITDDGAESLAQVIPLCRALTSLKLEYNLMTYAGQQVLFTAKGRCVALKEICFTDHDPFDSDDDFGPNFHV
jgi:Ran GTPase-activating protein (RanGAP) involved in mRNA processing and transport